MGSYVHSVNDYFVAPDIQEGLYYELQDKTLRGVISQPTEDAVKQKAFKGDETRIDQTNIIHRKPITRGLEAIFTFRTPSYGKSTYGDQAQNNANSGSFKNLKMSITDHHSPIFSVPGRIGQQTVNETIKDYSKVVKDEALRFMREELDYELLLSVLTGASTNLLDSANGGSNFQLNAGQGTAGVAQCPRYFFTPDEEWVTFSETQATYNAAVNTALNEFESEATEKLTLARLRWLRHQLDLKKFVPASGPGFENYKAVVLCDAELVARLKGLLDQAHLDGTPRSLKNPYFWSLSPLEYMDMLFVPITLLQKLRPEYSSTLGRPKWGADLPTGGTNFRTFTSTSTIALMYVLGKGGIKEANNGKVRVTMDVPDRHQPEKENFSVHYQYGLLRSEYWSKDSTVTGDDAAFTDNCFVLSFYEPGILS